MQKLIKALSALDWVVGTLSLAWGLYSGNAWFIAGGALGLVTAYYKPAVRIQAALEKRFLRKKPANADNVKVQAEDAFYANMLGTDVETPATPAAVVAAAPDFTRTLPAGPVLVNSSRHNLLKPTHLNLVQGTASTRHWA